MRVIAFRNPVVVVVVVADVAVAVVVVAVLVVVVEVVSNPVDPPPHALHMCVAS